MTPRSEARLAALLCAGALALVVWAMFAARCSDELHADLLARARAGSSVGARARAMNSLCLRGYWDVRPPAELDAFLDSAPEDVSALMRNLHFYLLGERAPGAEAGGCAGED